MKAKTTETPEKKPAAVKVKFLVDREVQDERAGTEHAQVFKANKTYELPQTSADRWVRRGVAVIID